MLETASTVVMQHTHIYASNNRYLLYLLLSSQVLIVEMVCIVTL